MNYMKPCCLCGNPFAKPDFGSNPYPILDKGRCCSWCDTVLVSSLRILMVTDSKAAHKILQTIRTGIKSYNASSS